MNATNSNKAKLSADTLTGKQSVRATFTLPIQTIHLLSTVASQLGIKQKSIFDHLVENRHILDRIAGEARDYQPDQDDRKQKTFVLSKKSLNTLDSFAKKHALPRNVLVEISIKQLNPVIKEVLQRHENRKVLLDEMKGFRELMSRLIKRARHLLGEEDVATQNLEQVSNLFNKNIDELKSTIEKGKDMERISS